MTVATVVVLCSALAALPGITNTVVVRDWLFCGPFPVGVREGITGVIQDPATFQAQEGETLRTGLVQGGKAVWRRVAADSLGWLQTDYQDVRWDTIMDYYGCAGLMSAGYAWAEFSSPGACCALCLTSRTGFTLNGLHYEGNAYSQNWVRTPVVLDSGLNRVLLAISGFGDQRVRFMLVPPPAPVVTVCQDATVPDLIADSAASAWCGIPVLNATDERLDSLTLSISLPDGTIAAETLVSNLPALGVKKVPVRLSLPALPADTATVALPVSLRWREHSYADTLRLRVRKPEEPHKKTFLSAIDRSCQYYALLFPDDYDPAKRYALILALHGAGVEASGLAQSFKPKDWAFVVAPTNRRPFGFDWQDWGRLDALEVLDQVLGSLPIDPDRVYLTGHSMGGHGTWHVGLAHADLFAAAGAGAGWPSFQLYVPWFLQRTRTFAEPAQQAVRDMALAADNAPAMLENALNLPFFILHGGDDDNVPPIHGRNFAAWLEELGYQYVHKEVPGRGHWWRYEDLDLSVADDPDMTAFFQARSRDPGPRHVRFRTADLGQSNHSYWVTIERLTVVGRLAEIEAWASHRLVQVSTRNISGFSLELDQRLFFPAQVQVEIDAQRVPSQFSTPARLSFHKHGTRWRTGRPRLPSLHKKPSLWGPAKQAMFTPFVLVYGTQDSELTDFLRHTATQEALRWWLRGNGCAEVLPDSEVSPALVAADNIMLFGGPKENSYTRRVSSRLPVQVREGHVFLGAQDLGPELAALCVYPNPENPERLVLVRMGTDSEHTRLSFFWGLLHSGAGIPDFLVFDRTVRTRTWAGVRAAGFFGPDWNIDDRSAYIRD